MSIALMTLAFKTTLPSTQKFVLVALCDSANDQGECYPSVPTLADKCSLGQRTVQDALLMLEKDGHLRREFRVGRSTVYWLDPRSSRTPAAAAPPHQPHHPPAPAAPPPPQLPHHPPAAAAPITINEPSIESKKKKREAPILVAASVLVDAGFTLEVAEEFIACKASRKAPLTVRAWQDHCREAEKAGWSIVAAAEKVMAKTWKGFEALYVAKEAKPINGHGGPPFQTAKERDTANKAAWFAKSTGGLLGLLPPEDNTIEMEAIRVAQIGNR